MPSHVPHLRQAAVDDAGQLGAQAQHRGVPALQDLEDEAGLRGGRQKGSRSDGSSVPLFQHGAAVAWAGTSKQQPAAANMHGIKQHTYHALMTMA